MKKQKTITFVHTADTHFGVENYGKIDPKTGIHTRLLDFKKSLEVCVDDAIARNVDFFLFCGDAYKTASPSPTQQKLLLQLFLKLQCTGIPVIIVVGNHDFPASFGKAHSLDVFADLPLSGLHVISKPEILNLETKNGLVQIAGMPWPTRHNLVANEKHRFKDVNTLTDYISKQMGVIIKDMASKLDKKVPAVLAGHLTVSTGLFSGSERRAVFGSDPILLPSQLAIPPFNYVALGHLHRHQNLNKKGKIPIVYSGSTEAVDFGEMRDQKGYCLVSINPKNAGNESCTYEFITLQTRPMIKIEHEIDPKHNQTDQLVEAVKKAQIKNSILKIVYHLPENHSDRVDLAKLQRACYSAFHLASITPRSHTSTKNSKGKID
ncbi:exonuclease SbcCD subunit D [Candidatus Dependentiae bacterium]